MREMHPTEKVYTRGNSLDEDLVRVHLEFQFPVEKYFHLQQYRFELGFVLRENNKVIGIADIFLRFECVFHKLVEFVQVDIGKELRGEISEWQPFVRC